MNTKLLAFFLVSSLLFQPVVVRYSDAQSLKTVNKKVATLTKRVDIIDVTLQDAVAGRLPKKTKARSVVSEKSLNSTSWSGTVFIEQNSEGPLAQPISLTFNPSTETAGTWVSSPVSISHPIETSCQGTHSGSYTIVMNYIYFHNLVTPCWFKGGSAEVELRGQSMLLSPKSSIPSPVVYLTLQP